MKIKLEILLAEDNDGHAGLIKIYLNQCGFKDIIQFRNGEELLNYLNDKDKRVKHNKLLILLDIRMPKIDGLEALKKIKADNNLKKIPVIMLTTTENQHEIEECYYHGCNIYITKPIESENFEKTFKMIGNLINTIKIPEV